MLANQAGFVTPGADCANYQAQIFVAKERLVKILISAVFATLFAASCNPAIAESPARLTVVELYQSQGCSDCPPANANVIALSERPDLLTLSFGVTYWDQLGWKDTFASPQYTARQWDYARAFHRTEVFTPEVVVNGRADVVGSDRAELEALIAREVRANEPSIRITSNAVEIGAGKGEAQVWLVRFDPNTVQVPIARGENEGRTLPHKNVVKQLTALGRWTGKAQAFALPPSPNALWHDAVLVQAGTGGAIVAAAKRNP